MDGETQSPKQGKLVMGGKYIMYDESTGEGTSSICRRGVTNDDAQEPVAIKVYKTQSQASRGRVKGQDQVNLKKFTRQIKVLEFLKEPLQAPSDDSLWCEALSHANSSKLFMQLFDYSVSTTGEPGPHPDDGVMYVVTELASYSLKDYIKKRRMNKSNLSKSSVYDLVRQTILVTAGLHAKGLVHLDLKPENFMIFNGCLKLIDVDGCVQIDSIVPITDSSLSFSPCYCAPEWAAFLIDDVDEPTIQIRPALDVWSIGMTICEYVTLDAVLKPTYASFMKNGRSQRQAGFYFMEWLSSNQTPPVPKQVREFDDQLADLLSNHLLVSDKVTRASLAQCMSHPFIADGKRLRHSQTGPITDWESDDEKPELSMRRRLEDDSAEIVFQGKLWKLNHGGDSMDAKEWLLRDMWIANNGSLCYYSQKEDKRLVMFDMHQMHEAAFYQLEGAARPFAFQMEVPQEGCTMVGASAAFACDTEKEFLTWLNEFEQAKLRMMQTMHLGEHMANEMKDFRLKVKNRRRPVTDSVNEFAPKFKSKLWKLKSAGSRINPDDWFQRDMWLAQNGSFVYYSQRDSRENVYYTADDVAHASLQELPNEGSAYSFPFEIALSHTVGGVEFEPGIFATESAELRDEWIRHFSAYSQPLTVPRTQGPVPE